MELIDLNLIPGLTNPVCHVSQFDVGRVIKFNLFEGSAVYTLSGTETLTLIVKKPDNTILTQSITNTSSNYITISTIEQMCPIYGYNICELKIEDSGTVIHSTNFLMFVEKDPFCNGVETQSAIDNLTTQIEEILRTMDIGGGLHATYIDIRTATYTTSSLEVT